MICIVRNFLLFCLQVMECFDAHLFLTINIPVVQDEFTRRNFHKILILINNATKCIQAIHWSSFDPHDSPAIIVNQWIRNGKSCSRFVPTAAASNPIIVQDARLRVVLFASQANPRSRGVERAAWWSDDLKSFDAYKTKEKLKHQGMHASRLTITRNASSIFYQCKGDKKCEKSCFHHFCFLLWPAAYATAQNGRGAIANAFL